MSDTVRRAIAAFAAFSAPFIAAFLNSKGFSVSEAGVVSAEVGLFGYMAQSITNTLHARSVAASAAAATPTAAVNDLNKGPTS